MLPPIICISNMEWDSFIPTNRQQLMRRFAQRTRVAVVETPLPVLGSFIGHSKTRIRKRGWRRDGDVHVLQAWDWIPYPLVRRSHALSRLTDGAFRRHITAAVRSLGWPAPIVWFYASDGGDLLGTFGECLSVYHCVDDYDASARYTGFRRTAMYTEKKQEAALVRSADLVVVTAPHLAKRWGALNPHSHLLPNVADTELFSRALDAGPTHPLLATIPEPRIGYVGALDAYKVNYSLLADIARLRPDVHVVCVGPVGVGDRTAQKDLPQLPNIHYVGYLPQHELPAVLRGCLATIIPYNLNDYTAGVSPLKLYEYLAAGCPVVATPLPSLVAQSEGGVFLAQPQADAFAEALDRAMALPRDERRRNSERVMGHSWERRVDELEALLMERLSAE
ncbi:MAG TPA: glycosyltransferase [Ktedonobacterales bacterium]|nr:glycosyltransferase [Ktedonobacterales bacterium]